MVHLTVQVFHADGDALVFGLPFYSIEKRDAVIGAFLVVHASPVSGQGVPRKKNLVLRSNLFARVLSLRERMAEGQVRERFESSRNFPHPSAAKDAALRPLPEGEGFVTTDANCVQTCDKITRK